MVSLAHVRIDCLHKLFSRISLVSSSMLAIALEGTENPRVGGSSPPPGIAGLTGMWVVARVVNGGGL